MGLNAINDIKMQFSNFILHPYQEIFEPGKPDSEFENIRRRFSWLKRTLKEYNEKNFILMKSFLYSTLKLMSLN